MILKSALRDSTSSRKLCRLTVVERFILHLESTRALGPALSMVAMSGQRSISRSLTPTSTILGCDTLAFRLCVSLRLIPLVIRGVGPDMKLGLALNV